ncbi:MAG: hypothetical protein IT434_10670 [Phycisphaerales bacterium]|jgi:hypothetical protein|nr:hypothetical protein [Phycisphaerales bacterium]
MKSSELGGLAGRWTSARIAGLGVGLSCLAIGLVNSGMFAGMGGSSNQRSEPTEVNFVASADLPSTGFRAAAPTSDADHGVSAEATSGSRIDARPVRNVPLDFSVIFAAAASPGESDVAGLMADTNFDGVVDGQDVEDFVGTIDAAIDRARRTGFGGFSPRYDLNDDGRLDERDLELYLDAFGFGERGPRFKGVHLVKC